MKRYIFLFFTLAFIGCSSDDETPITITANDIVGKWWVEKRIHKGVDTATDCDKKDYIMITADLIGIEEGISKVKDGVCVTTIYKSDKDNPPVLIRVSNTKYYVKGEPNDLFILENKTTLKKVAIDTDKSSYSIFVKR